jgi:hypothetical protein
MILSSCHTQKEVESLHVDSTNIHHAFTSAWLFDLCDTITICQFDTSGTPQKQTQIIRHRKQNTQVTAVDTTSQKHVQLNHQTKTTDKYQLHMESYDTILNWSLLLAFLLFSAIIYKRLHL